MSGHSSPIDGPSSWIDQRALQELFDELPDVVFFVKDLEGRYVAVNRTLVERSGARSKEDLLGRTAEEVFPQPLGSSFTTQDRWVLRTGAEIRDRLELHLYSRRTQGWCLTFKTPLRDGDGGLLGLIGISRDLRRADKGHPGFQQLASAVQLLRERFGEPLRLEAVARGAGLSMGRLERLFKEVFQLTPRQVLAKIRIEAASSLLRDGRQTIAEIAHACGYSDHSAFTRQFRAVVGLAPSQVRRNPR